ncbi:hypothetical protein JCM14469_32810 [Desulfatiferula olefinivorans]
MYAKGLLKIAGVVFLLCSGTAAHASTIAFQDFNSLPSGFNTTTDSVSSGSQLTHAGSSAMTTGATGLGFTTYWFDTRGETTGPVTPTNDTSDFVGVNAFTGSNAPNVSAAGSPVSAGSEHNFEFSDGDGRLDLVFDAVNVSAYSGVTLSLDYWITNTGYETGDMFSIGLSDGNSQVTLLSLNDMDLESSASADDGTANWKRASFDLDDYLNAAMASSSACTFLSPETLSLIVSVDTNAASENIFVDNILIEGSEVPVPATLILFGSGLAGLAGVRRMKTRVRS